MKRAWMKKVKAVPGCGIKDEALERKLKPAQPKEKLQLFRTSAATIGLIVSIGTPNLLLTQGSRSAPATQVPNEESATNQTAPTPETVQDANNLVPETAVQIAPASTPIEAMTAQKLEPQVVKRDLPVASKTRRQAIAKTKLERYSPAPIAQASAPTSIEAEVTATSKRSLAQNYRTLAPQGESSAPVVTNNIEPVETIAATPQTVTAVTPPADSRVNRLVARLQANKNVTEQSASVQQSPARQLAVQPQPVIVNPQASSAWTPKQRLLVESLRQKEQPAQLSSASATTPAVNLEQPQTPIASTPEIINQYEQSPSNNVVVEAQPLQPTVPTPVVTAPILNLNTPATSQKPAIASQAPDRDKGVLETSVQQSSVNRLMNRLGLPPVQTTEGVSSSATKQTTANAQQLPAEVDASIEPSNAIALDETHAEPLPQSVFVLPSETPETATNTQVSADTAEAVDQLPSQVATAPVETATIEVVSNADGVAIATPAPEYQVKSGDTLSAIATEHKVSVPEIISANHLQDPNLLLVNQRIKIPSLVDNKAEKVTVAVLPEVQPASTSGPAPVPQADATLPVATNEPNKAVLVSARSLQPIDAVNQLPANSYNGVGGSDADEGETSPLSQAQLDKLQVQYAQELQSDVQKLQHKYYAQNNSNLSAQAVAPRLPAKTKSPTNNELPVDEPVNPEFVVAQKAQDLQPASQRQLTIKPNYSVPARGRVATAPTDVNSGENFTEQQVAPELPPLAPVDNYLPQPNGRQGSLNAYIWPAKGVLSSKYGMRWGRMHRGIDIAAPVGTPIFAAAEGVVIRSGWNKGGYGNLVDIQHADGTLTRYAHNYRLLVQPGQIVEQGQQISLMGSTGRSTGPHLHFEVHPGGKGTVNPIALLPKK